MLKHLIFSIMFVFVAAGSHAEASKAPDPNCLDLLKPRAVSLLDFVYDRPGVMGPSGHTRITEEQSTFLLKKLDQAYFVVFDSRRFSSNSPEASYEIYLRTIDHNENAISFERFYLIATDYARHIETRRPLLTNQWQEFSLPQFKDRNAILNLTEAYNANKFVVLTQPKHTRGGHYEVLVLVPVLNEY